MVKDAVDAAPGSIDVYDRNGDPALELDPGNCYYGTGSDCPTTIAPDTSERRSCLKSDIESLAAFSDALPNIDFLMSFGIAGDSPGGEPSVVGTDHLKIRGDADVAGQ